MAPPGQWDRVDLGDVADFDEMRRLIREDEPPRPSARISTLEAVRLSTISDQRQIDSRKLGQSLRGELDWIVMKALEKDRTRRYETANGLAADIEHYLNDEPVVACPPSPAYRFRKFTRRNKGVLTAASVVAVALVLGMIGTAWQAVRANAERDIARTKQKRAVAAEQLANRNLGRAVKAENAAHVSRRKAEDHSQQVTRLLASNLGAVPVSGVCSSVRFSAPTARASSPGAVCSATGPFASGMPPRLNRSARRSKAIPSPSDSVPTACTSWQRTVLKITLPGRTSFGTSTALNRSGRR